jgi:hypothetical protein
VRTNDFFERKIKNKTLKLEWLLGTKKLLHDLRSYGLRTYRSDRASPGRQDT